MITLLVGGDVKTSDVMLVFGHTNDAMKDDLKREVFHVVNSIV